MNEVNCAAVVGGGIAGIQASLELASAGIKVYLIEKADSIGGHMALLDKTFPTNDCSMCILAPKMIECLRNPNIEIMTSTEVVRAISNKQNKTITLHLKRKKLQVDEKKCTGCGECSKVCPVNLPDETSGGIGTRKPIWKPFPQAIPNVYRISSAGTAPCKIACPAHINTQGYCALISDGRFKEALEIIMETTPLAGILGRVCPHPCEDECNRRDAPVNLAGLKRAASDFGWSEGGEPHVPELKGKGKKGQVAIVGSGPAGLQASYDLARMGHEVTIFEAMQKPGGMLRYGIPPWRLPEEILNREISIIEKLGVQIKTCIKVGQDIPARELIESFDAIFIATGAWKERKIGIKGERSEYVISSIEFLRRINSGEKITVPEKVTVIGGGNSAIDSARAALRLGAKHVSIIYRRGIKEMPAITEEVREACEEGVKIISWTAPVEIICGAGKVSGLKLIRTAPGQIDRRGRRRPLIVEGTEYFMPTEMVIAGVGQTGDIEWIKTQMREIVKTTVAAIETKANSSQTALAKIFAGGDIVTGPATVISAIAEGIRAAMEIDSFIACGEVSKTTATAKSYKKAEVEQIIKTRKKIPQTHPRIDGSTRWPMIRKKSFSEVRLSLNRDDAIKEAQRCINCGECSSCGSCVRACEAKAINLSRTENDEFLTVRACIISSGFDLMDASIIPGYGYGKLPDVITAMEFERLLNASGPTSGQVRRPSDGKLPANVAFIQCVGSRDHRYHHHCSGICCMFAVKEALLLNEHHKQIHGYIFYTDMRAYGKGFKHYIERARTEYGVRFIRGRPSHIEENGEGGALLIYEDTTTKTIQKKKFDLIVLCNALVPPTKEKSFEHIYGILSTKAGFVLIPDPIENPCCTTVEGIYGCGFCTGPKDIPESVIEASAAAHHAYKYLTSITESDSKWKQ